MIAFQSNFKINYFKYYKDILRKYPDQIKEISEILS